MYISVDEARLLDAVFSGDPPTCRTDLIALKNFQRKLRYHLINAQYVGSVANDRPITPDQTGFADSGCQTGC